MDQDKINETLNEKQQNILRGMGKRKMMLFVRAMTKTYSKLCMDCRIKAHNKTDTPLDEYCDKCRFKIKNTLEKFT